MLKKIGLISVIFSSSDGLNDVRLINLAHLEKVFEGVIDPAEGDFSDRPEFSVSLVGEDLDDVIPVLRDMRR